MKKYIYLVIGLIILLFSLPGVFSNLRPATDDFNRGYNFGLFMVPIIGLILIFNFFRLSRKERIEKNKTELK